MLGLLSARPVCIHVSIAQVQPLHVLLATYPELLSVEPVFVIQAHTMLESLSVRAVSIRVLIAQEPHRLVLHVTHLALL
jgi:hypothetical protein